MPNSYPLLNSRFLMMVGEQYEDLDLWYPKFRLMEAGAEITVAGPEVGVVYHGRNGYPCRSEAVVYNMKESDFDGVLIPGGFMSETLRRDQRVLDLVRGFSEEGKLIAVICQGGWIPISAKIYHGVRATGSPGIKDDLINAGAVWEDAPVVVDRHFVSSRRSDDLPAFCQGILQVMKAASCVSA